MNTKKNLFITISYFTLNVDKKRYCLIGIGVIDLLYAFLHFTSMLVIILYDVTVNLHG